MAGSLTLTTLSDGTNSTSVTNCIQGSAKAWVCWNGTGTPAIRASYNVSSITDNGTGDFTVNFTNAFTDTNYALAGITCNDVVGGSSQCVITEKDTGVRTTTSVRVYTGIGTGRYDFPYNSIIANR
jgi:hypothetical protein